MAESGRHVIMVEDCLRPPIRQDKDPTMTDKLQALKAWIQDRIEKEDASGQDAFIPALWQALAEIAQEKEDRLPPLTQITAEEVQLLVTDQETGRTFHRLLPLDYRETSNGITLAGETYAAQPTQIVFLTEFALGKLLELQGEEGEGDHDHHHDHDHDHPHH